MFCNFVFSRQHSIGYMGDGFTGQKTQPTVSKYWRRYSAAETETWEDKWTYRTRLHVVIKQRVMSAEERLTCHYINSHPCRQPQLVKPPATNRQAHSTTCTWSLYEHKTLLINQLSIIVFDLITNGHAAYRLLCFSFFFIFSLSDNKWQTKLATMLNHPITSERKGWGCKQRIMSAEERLTSYDINWIGLTMV